MGKCAHDISELKHEGDIYIIGSGATLDYWNPDFFLDKTVIGLNLIYKFFPCTYMLTHHHPIVQEAIDSGQTVITSKHDICLSALKEHDFSGEYYIYYHTEQGFTSVNIEEIDGVLAPAGTPVVASLQVAYKMGAKNIILVGIDGGLLDGRMNFKYYPTPTQAGHPGRVQGVIEKTANKIREKGVGVYSMIPFVNLTLEGHKFS